MGFRFMTRRVLDVPSDAVFCMILIGLTAWFAAGGARNAPAHVLLALASIALLAHSLGRRQGRLVAVLLSLSVLIPLVVRMMPVRADLAATRVLSWWRVRSMGRQFERMRSEVEGQGQQAVDRIPSSHAAGEGSRLRALEALGDGRYTGFVLYTAEPIAWGGNIPGFLEVPSQSEVVVRTDVSSYYTRSFEVPSTPGMKLVVYRLLSTHADVSNRWFIDYDFFGVHPERTATGIAVEYLVDDAEGSEPAVSSPGIVHLPDRAHPLVRLTVTRPQQRYSSGGTLLAFLLFLPLAWAYWTRWRGHPIARVCTALVAGLLAHHVGAAAFGDSALASPAYFAMPLTGDFFGSPLDLLVLAVVLMTVLRSLNHMWPSQLSISRGWRGPAAFLGAAAAAASILGYQVFLGRVVNSTAGNLLLNPFTSRQAEEGWLVAHMAIQSSLLLILACAVFFASSALATAWQLLSSSPRRLPAQLFILLLAGVACAWPLRSISLPFYPTSVGFVVLALASLTRPTSWDWRRIAGYTLPSLVFFQFSLEHFSDKDRRNIVSEHTVKRITGEDAWAEYLLARSQRQVDDYLRTAPQSDRRLAFKVWARTDLALFGFSSGVELWDEFGQRIGRFDLNTDGLDTAPSTALDLNWRVREAESVGPLSGGMIVAERRNELPEGILLIRLTVRRSYDNLLFLSSVNPYLALFRSPQLDILEENLFGGRLSLLVIDRAGSVVLNPGDIDFSIGREEAGRLKSERAGMFWLSFASRGERFHGLLFQNGRERCLLYYPRTSAAGYVAGFVRLLLHVLVLGPLALVLSGKQVHNPARPGFATKVYAGLLLASLVPLLAYTVLLRTYLDRRMRAETERHGVSVAQVARKFIEDFVAFRIQRGESPSDIFNDDLAIWIQRIVRQDFNIFEGRLLVATSRRELYESALVPDFVDGRVFERIVKTHAPFYNAYGYLGKLRLLTINTPLAIPGAEQPMILSVPIPIQEREVVAEREELGQSIVMISSIVVVFALLIAQRLARLISKPVETLVAGTSHIARGEFDYRIPAEGHDEVRLLVDSFNKMAQDLKTYQDETIKASRLKVLAEMARRVAHEIKNPLTPIRLSVEHVRKVYEDGSPDFPQIFDHCLDNILREVEILRKLSQDFGLFSRTEEPRWEQVDLQALITEITDPYSVGLEGDIEMSTHWEPVRTNYLLDREKTRRALSNILLNAVQATRKGRIEWRIAEHEGHVAIALSDTGCGIPPDVMSKLFQPYFSTKDRGTGLGLAITRKDIEDQGGSLTIESSGARGTMVVVKLPVRDEG
ncbi:MAG: HAMP domain-containing protein [Acidobacteria bacterium]|nr:HAMP domain-containing protein [Acidobacteriota bacterium]